jgi:plasmid maintenance system antidote protein VapI
VFNTTPDFWINLQGRYDLLTARSHIALDGIKPLVAA